MSSIGRPYSPTDLQHPLLALLGQRVRWIDGDRTRYAELSNVTADGMATLADGSSVVAVIPASEVNPSCHPAA